MDLQIVSGDLDRVVSLSQNIGEFKSPYNIDEYEKRLNNSSLILTGEIEEKAVGFKVGYDRFKDGSFYSWMGGVLPKFRRMGVAYSLANFQEKWAAENKFSLILLKTRKKHDGMIAFSLNRGFIITEETQITPDEETRIWMQKSLNS